jgi:FAD/FMN-containing dehydrogenase
VQDLLRFGWYKSARESINSNLQAARIGSYQGAAMSTKIAPPPAARIERAVLEHLKEAAGPKGWIEDAAGKAPYLDDFRGLFHGEAPLVLRPADTAGVASIMRICHEHAIGVVPQGGNTGYCGGATPSPAGNEIVLSLGRMKRIRNVDPLNNSITVDAGCILADIQRAAEEADRLFPLSLAAEGSCQIGGNLSTNAGGTAVLRYGNARDLALGLEVVLPDGQIWDGLRHLRKDNTGYDLKQLFIGAEGTLGIITAASLKLFARPRHTSTAFIALANAQSAVTLLARAKNLSGDAVTTFEYLHRACLDLVFARDPTLADPFTARHDHYALIELSAGADIMETILGDALEAGEITDAVIAASNAQASALWQLRETIPESLNHAGGVIRHDVSVPLSRIAEFLDTARACAQATIPGVRITPFGHIGDGNIHFNLVQPEAGNREAFLARTHEIETAIHDIANALDGSFSAEHGIGQLKRGELARYKSPEVLEQMQRIKQAFDPKGIMNPGKVL